MNNQISKPHTQINNPYRTPLRLSTETKQLMSLGKHKGWNFQILGQAPLPERTVRIGDWLLSPAETDSSLIPTRTLTRIQAIFADGIRPKGFVLVHEAPRLLPSPSDGKEKKSNQTSFSLPNPNFLPKSKTVNQALEGAGKVITGFVSALVEFLSFVVPVILSSTLLLGAVMIDPILVAVTDDCTWIAVDFWNLPSE